MKSEAIVAALLLGVNVSAFAASTAVCAGAGAGATVTAAATPLFIKTDFTTKCSNNVFSAYDETDAQVGVCANSKKGKADKIGGSSESGKVQRIGTGECGSSGCTAPTASATSGC